ncbi:LysR family transcriptional regulator [Uliginosibacterium paludis]|uniref:LysR family transcriptional regulator n=1 Tax=Uliginosibacterium paludis TaxID=1615952 RepID=A0ABV2CSI0_9RHOO
MDTLTSMRVFATVVETRSFTAAANRLAISTAMASKHVQHLEAHLGTRLLNRTTRKLSLTDSGLAYFERCSQILADIDESEAEAVSLTARPHGTLRVTMPVSFAVRHMAPMLSRYMQQYPEVHLDLFLSDRRTDLIDNGLDLALRIGPSPEPSLIARRLATDSMMMCASPAYLAQHGRPRTPAELAGHNCLLYSYASIGNEWRLQGPDGEQVVKVGGTLRINNGDLLNQMAIAGHGIMCQPEFLVRAEVESGQLEEILPDYRMAPIGIYAVYSSRKHLSAKIRSFVDCLVDYLAEKGKLQPDAEKAQHG